jgi:hypothetical protein
VQHQVKRNGPPSFCASAVLLQLLVTPALKALYQEALSFGSGWNAERGVALQQQQQQAGRGAIADPAAADEGAQSAVATAAAGPAVAQGVGGPVAADGSATDSEATARAGVGEPAQAEAPAAEENVKAAAGGAAGGAAAASEPREVPSLYVLSAGVAVATWSSRQLGDAGVPEQVLEHIYSLAGKVGQSKASRSDCLNMTL